MTTQIPMLCFDPEKGSTIHGRRCGCGSGKHAHVTHAALQTRKNDKKSFQKMVELRLNFERTRNILELMKQREKLKQERIQLMRSAFEVQLQMLQKQAKEDPNAEREVLHD